jgi:hypothetical protein
MVSVIDVDGRFTMDQGLDRFSIAHDIKIEQFLAFKALKGLALKVIIKP